MYCFLRPLELGRASLEERWQGLHSKLEMLETKDLLILEAQNSHFSCRAGKIWL